MSVDQLPPGKVRGPARDAKLVGYDEYIDAQITSTRRLVKAVDIATVVLTLAAGILGFLLVAAVAEHWFVAGGFGFLTRTILFAALLSGVGYYAIWRLWPLVFRRINPVYAAHTIEQGSPSLKNSLLNLLLFREQRDEITDAVYETLEQQAAQRLTRVPVEASVDRTHLVRLGYVMVAIVLACAVYKIFSPKDPLATAGRVLMPWSDIVPASRVSITNVEPGTTTLARGETLNVSAEVRGIGEDDPVVVRYTTADGQAVNKTVQLAPSAAGLRFSGRIPAATAGAPIGLAQDLTYRIEAGDAHSREFRVSVIAAPTITVERIDYDYPSYTGFADRTVSGLGDIRAIEGTNVTIHARANEPIEEASIDFEADGRRDIVMALDDVLAHTPFVLALRDDRLTPKFTSYVLRFTTLDGRKNKDPVKFTIDVVPDLVPEVTITAPREKIRNVRLDETLAIDVEARDPDFALADVRLQGEVAGRRILDEPLLTAPHAGRFTGRHLFTPHEHGLQAGDVVRYWVAARDNRMPSVSFTTSEPQSLRIVSPDPNRPQPPPDRLAQRDQRQPQQRNEPQDGKQQQGEAGNAGGESNSNADGQQQGEPASAGGASASQSNQSPESQPNNQPDQQQNNQSGNAGGNDQSSGDQSAAGQSAHGNKGQESNNAPQQPGGATRPQNGNASPNQSQQPPGGASSGGQQRGGKPSDGKPGSQGTPGERSENASGEQRAGEPQQQGDNQRESQANDRSPVSPNGDNDGEAFERIQEFLKRQGNLNEDGKSQDEQSEDGKPQDAPQNDSQEGESASADGANSQQQPGAKPRPGDPPQQSQQPQDQPNDSQSPGGEQTSSKGEPGAGDEPQTPQGSPDSQPNMKPGSQSQQQSAGENQSPNQEPPSGGRGKRESDSQGGQGGDRAGGGEEGGGQRANREGTGSSGENQSAEEGGGEASKQGAGNESQNAGEDSSADGSTGQSGSKERGEGSSQRDGQGEQQGGGSLESGDRNNAREDSMARADEQGESSEPDESPAATEESDDENQQEQPGVADSGAPTGDGTGLPHGARVKPKTEGTTPEADAANLEFARHQTDLVLESLAEQLKRQKVDNRLLDELGWSPDDLQRFLDRWQQLKATAAQSNPEGDAARRELDDALRSLGLRRGPLRQNAAPDDAIRDLRQGYRGAVPLEYQERLRAYNQGVSRAKPDED